MTRIFKYCFDKWWRPVIFFGLTAVIFGFFLLAIAQFWANQLLPDHYADNLIIPENIEIYDPIGDGLNSRGDSTFQANRKEFDFELYKSFQPGLYEYDL